MASRGNFYFLFSRQLSSCSMPHGCSSHKDELVVVCAPQHPLAKSKSVDVATMAEYPLLLPKYRKNTGGHRRSFSASTA